MFQLIDYIATCKQLQAFHGSKVLRILSDQGTEFVNQDFEKHARQRGLRLATSPAHHPQSNGVAERLVTPPLVGLAKQCTRCLLLAAGLPDLCWSYAVRLVAEMLRHKALGFQRRVPAFGEGVGMWRSHDKKQAKSHHKGAVGRLIAIDPWGNGTCVLIAKRSDLQDPELVHGLQPKTVAVECLPLSQPRLVPDGWNQDALKQFACRWQTIRTPDGKDLWLKMDTGETEYTSPFVAETQPDSSVLAEEPTAYWGEATDPANAVVRPEVVVFQPPVEQLVQARASLTDTVPKARVIPNRIVMSTSGAQYDRWKQATRKELQAFLKTAWKEPTPELRSRYFASKKKVVMQFSVRAQPGFRHFPSQPARAHPRRCSKRNRSHQLCDPCAPDYDL